MRRILKMILFFAFIVLLAAGAGIALANPNITLRSWAWRVVTLDWVRF